MNQPSNSNLDHITDISVPALECFDNDTQNEGGLILHANTLKRIVNKGQSNLFAEFQKLVKPCVAKPIFVFKGLQRPLFSDDDSNCDDQKFVYVSNPRFDFIWKGGKFHGNVQRSTKPVNCVFTVIVSKNILHREKYPHTFGFIEEWCWCYKETGTNKPVNWIDRYITEVYDKATRKTENKRKIKII